MDTIFAMNGKIYLTQGASPPRDVTAMACALVDRIKADGVIVRVPPGCEITLQGPAGSGGSGRVFPGESVTLCDSAGEGDPAALRQMAEASLGSKSFITRMFPGAFVRVTDSDAFERQTRGVTSGRKGKRKGGRKPGKVTDPLQLARLRVSISKALVATAEGRLRGAQSEAETAHRQKVLNKAKVRLASANLAELAASNASGESA